MKVKKEFLLTYAELYRAVGEYLCKTRPGSLPIKHKIQGGLELDDESVKLTAEWEQE